MEDTRQEAINVLKSAAEKWPSEIFTREGLVEFSNKAISLGHLANLDSQGAGPEGAFYLGRKRVYPKSAAVNWLIKRLSV